MSGANNEVMKIAKMTTKYTMLTLSSRYCSSSPRTCFRRFGLSLSGSLSRGTNGS